MYIHFSVGSRGFWQPDTPTRVGYFRHKSRINDRAPSPFRDTPRSAIRRHAQRVAHALASSQEAVQLAPGHLVVYDYRAYRIVSTGEFDDSTGWPDTYEAQHEEALAQWMCTENPDPWPGRSGLPFRPVVIVVEPARGGDPTHLCAPANQRWDVLPPHYAACVECEELSPCLHGLRQLGANRLSAEAKVRMGYDPSGCAGCGEPITGRQKMVEVPGPHLWNPLAEGPALFHGKEECSGFLYEYQKARRDKQAREAASDE